MSGSVRSRRIIEPRIDCEVRTIGISGLVALA